MHIHTVDCGYYYEVNLLFQGSDECKNNLIRELEFFQFFKNDSMSLFSMVIIATFVTHY